jgi:hypothetical protein
MTRIVARESERERTDDADDTDASRALGVRHRRSAREEDAFFIEFRIKMDNSVL